MDKGERPSELADLLGPFWASAWTQVALGLPTPSALEDRRADGSVLGLTTADGVTVYPICQFRLHNGTVEVKPALLPVLRTLKDVGSWTVAALLHTPASELAGLSPLEWLSAGNPQEDLGTFAHAVARDWGR